MQETGGSGRGCGGIIFREGATQYSNGCRQTTMTKNQLLNHSRGSGLDHEHGLLSGMPRVCELGVFSRVVGCILLRYGACSWLHSQTVRGVGVGFEEPHLRLMV